YATQAIAFSEYLDDYVRFLAGNLLKKRLLVFGRVSLWGRVVEHDLGWRASHAFPERLFVIPGRVDARTVEATIRGLGRYGVAVVRCADRRRRMGHRCSAVAEDRAGAGARSPSQR